jgi:hypothetical protein
VQDAVERGLDVLLFGEGENEYGPSDKIPDNAFCTTL